MKTKYILTYLFLLIITIQYLSGQENCYCHLSHNLKSEPDLSGELFDPAQPLDIITYFNTGWLLGDIFLTNGEIVKNKYIKYNGLLDELLWLEPKLNKIIKLDKEGIERFHFLNFKGDTSVYFSKIHAKRYALVDSSEIFGQELFNGKLSLFVFHNFVIERREISNNEGIISQKDVYGEEPIYYFRFMNNKTVAFKSLNRKSLYSIAPDKKDQIKKFFKENKQMDFNTNPELVRLAEFLSSIVAQ